MERVSALTVSYSYGTHKVMPKINLIGKYLNTFGFEIGDKVHVRITEHRIEIVKAEVEQTELIVIEPQVK